MFALNSIQEANDLIFICETATECKFLKILELRKLYNEVVSQDIIREVDTDERAPKKVQDLYNSINWTRLKLVFLISVRFDSTVCERKHLKGFW